MKLEQLNRLSNSIIFNVIQVVKGFHEKTVSGMKKFAIVLDFSFWLN